MTLNPTLPPTLAEFRAVFPEFNDIPDPTVQFYIDTAMLWVDDWWTMIDAKLAAMYAAAHYLWLHNIASGGAISSGGSSGGGGGVGGGVVDPEIGKIWVKTVRFRDRLVTYDRVGVPDQMGGGGDGSSTSTAEKFWEGSPYGQMYLSFQRRNVPHIAVI